MKVFWVSCVLFLVLLAGIFWNARYIRTSEAYLRETVEAMGTVEGRGERLSELEEFWKKHRDLFGLSVGFRELDHFEELLVELRWAHDGGLESEFQRCRALLLDAIEEISRNEQISVGNIF